MQFTYDVPIPLDDCLDLLKRCCSPDWQRGTKVILRALSATQTADGPALDNLALEERLRYLGRIGAVELDKPLHPYGFYNVRLNSAG